MMDHPLNRKITLPLKEFMDLGRWTATGSSIASRLVIQGHTQAARALGVFWFENLSPHSGDCDPITRYYTLSKSFGRSLITLFPHRKSFAAHLGAIKENSKTPWQDQDANGGCPTQAWPNAQLIAYWGWLHKACAIFDELR